MNLPKLVAIAVLLVFGVSSAQAQEKVVLVIHGGAGVESRAQMTPELEKAYRTDLEKALRTGYEAMQRDGGTSLDGVQAAINVMEDSPLFNAGRGAVLNREGKHELNASIMEGKTKKAGAVAGLSRVKNPITAARLVMEKSDHVFLIGEGAERFAREQGLKEVNPLYFVTEKTWKRLKDAQAREKGEKVGVAENSPAHFGTVGAVALDKSGNLAAGTSTGGISFKLPGRVGDSPLIGAGTYAENASCAVSCTGHGELFIRHAVAYDIAARMKYKKQSVADAAADAFKALPPGPRDGGGTGGLIALDRQGGFTMPYNTNGMPRGYVTADGKIHVMIYEK